jgi:predicted AlkP superfamily phosphohydrolase/phosphomutase
MSPRPVAFFGFDAIEPLLVRQGIVEGWLPTLARILEAGRYAVLEPVPSRFYNAGWVSLVSGTDVQDHRGVLDRVLEPGTYRIVDKSASTFGRPPFWRYISDAGLRSTVASIYSSAVLPSFRGTQVQGWGSIDPYFAKFGETTFDPPEVEQLLRRAAGRRQALYRVTPPQSASQFRRYRDRLLRSIDEQTRGLEALVTGTEWDFFFGSFAESHQAGHLLWHLTDPEHPDYDPEVAADIRDALLAIYRAVDAGLGRLIDRLPPESRYFVLTPHGMGPFYIEDPLELLLELGGWLDRGAVAVDEGLRQRSLRSVWKVGRRIIPVRSRLRVFIAKSRAGRHQRAAMLLSHVDWSRTRAFALPSDMTSYVRINLAGREPEGIVSPGPEYEQLCDELIATLGAVTDADTGRPAVERVVRLSDLVGGPITDSLPDICVVWQDGQLVRRFHLPGHGPVESLRNDPRTGQHRHLGFMLGAGDGIEPSRDEVRGNLLDVAPTALALLGVDPPAELPGRPIEAFA